MRYSKYNKYNNHKVEYEGKVFDSQLEFARYRELQLLERCGEIRDLKWQVSFELIPKQPGEQAVKYVADFVYLEGNKNVVEDAKGRRTPDYIIKRKLFKYRYPEYIFRETGKDEIR